MKMAWYRGVFYWERAHPMMRHAKKLARSQAGMAFRPDPILATPTNIAEGKVRQASKIRELKSALIRSGLITLDQQANALGLSRSTTWTILRGNHKASGLSALIIDRVLSSPNLPSLVRTKILEYVREKTSGLYGHSDRRMRKFSDRLRSGIGGPAPPFIPTT
jgi:hypothetical protein